LFIVFLHIFVGTARWRRSRWHTAG